MALARPLAFLRQAGFFPACFDLAVQSIPDEVLREATLVAIAAPMHTALRLSMRFVERVRRVNPSAHVTVFGLYAELNREHLSALVDTVIGVDAERDLVALSQRVLGTECAPQERKQLGRLPSLTPVRDALPPLTHYARLRTGSDEHLVGHTETSYGCRHHCRHCPLPAVYHGRFFAVGSDSVLADIDQLVLAGARHISFGDPDFFNAPKHSLAVAAAMRRAHPDITFDATIKVEHLLQHRHRLAELREHGCVFVVSAFESLSDVVLAKLHKGHTRAESLQALSLLRQAQISLRPTFIPFTPWSTMHDYVELCEFIGTHNLVHEVDPVQLTLRLLVPPGSLLLSEPPFGGVDQTALTATWSHPDPRMDQLQTQASALVERFAQRDARDTFAELFALVDSVTTNHSPLPVPKASPHAPPPRLTEPWFC